MIESSVKGTSDMETHDFGNQIIRRLGRYRMQTHTREPLALKIFYRVINFYKLSKFAFGSGDYPIFYMEI